jgi:hypothetical protein
MKVRTVGTELFHADWQMDGREDERTDLSKVILAFRDFVNERKLLLSAPSSFPAVDRCLQIEDGTARLKIMNQSLAANMTESNNINPLKTDTANNFIAFFLSSAP